MALRRVRVREAWRAGAAAALLLALLTILAAPAAAAPPHGDRPLRSVTLQLKWTHQFQFAGFYAAVAKGFFREAGFHVELREGGPAVDPAVAVAEGRADFGVGTAALLLDLAAGRPVVAVAPIFQHSPFVIVALRRPGLDDIPDLRGRTIMAEEHSAELDAYLALAGITVTRVPHTGDVRDLKAGVVDGATAYTTTELYDLVRHGIPYQVFNPREMGIDFYGDTLFTSRQLAHDDPALVRAFRDAALKGWRYALAHPNEIIDLVATRYAPGMERRKLEFEAEEIRRLMIADVVDVGYMHADRWQAIADTFAAAGLLPPDLPLDDFLFDPTVPQPDLRWFYGGLSAAAALVLAAFLVTWRFHALNRALHREIALRRRAEAELTRQAITDPLTGLYNRRHFDQEAALAVRRARRTQEPLAVLFLDLDHFKQVNDGHGHAVGDRALQAFADLCATTLRDIDILGRYGGEELAIVLPGATAESARQVGDRLRELMATLTVQADDGTPVRLTLSGGVAALDAGDDSIDAVLGRADAALYEAKSLGRDRIVVAPPPRRMTA